MSNNDPFSQLAHYMKKQKTPVRTPKQRQRPRVVNETKTNSQNVIELRRKKKVYGEVGTWKDFLDKTINGTRYVEPSPMRERENNTKNRIFHEQEKDDKFNTNVLNKTKRKRIPERRGASTKSYDFTRGELDRDEIRSKRAVYKKNKMIEDYKQTKQYWNKETDVV